MSGRPSREAVMNALFSALQAMQVSLTADTTANDATMANPNTTAGLSIGLPIVGGSLPRGAVITSISPLQVDQAPTANGTAVPMIAGVQTFSRRLKRWQDVSAQPALFLRGADERLEYPNTVLQEQIIGAEIWLYSQAGQNPDLAPETALNNLLDALQDVMAPDSPMQQFTLGGLVQWCRMSGKIDKYPGDLDGQAIAVAEVEIFVI